MSEPLSVPWVAIGADEMGPPLAGSLKCPRCSKRHRIKSSRGKSSSGAPGSMTLESYRCGGKTYICGINGASINWRKG